MENDKAESPQFVFERRSYSRFMVELPVEYRRSNDSRLRPGHTVNFGEDGLMVLVSEQMETGESLEMKIYFSSASGLVTIAAIVKVIWADIEAKKGGYYRVGVRYADISPADMQNLKGFLNMYADPNQAAAEMKPPAGSLFNPSKPSAPESRGRPPVAVFPLLTFLKRILGLGRRAMRKGKSR
jgi:hypothetical protein